MTDERARLIALDRGTIVHALASLAGAISLLEKGGKAAKKAAPSDKMFNQMLVDYRRALNAARATIERTDDER